MGCHTWFNRKITQEEYEWMKEWAVKEAEELFLELEDGKHKEDLEAVKRSVETGEACYYGMTWYEAGFGVSNPKFIERDGVHLNVRYIPNRKKTGVEALYVGVEFNLEYLEKFYNGMSYNEFIKTDFCNSDDYPYFCDVFRVYTYPNKVIHSKKELRRYLRKRYFELSKEQLREVSNFFRLYPGGVINFG